MLCLEIVLVNLQKNILIFCEKVLDNSFTMWYNMQDVVPSGIFPLEKLEKNLKNFKKRY